MIAEFVGGYLSNSIAVMSDAAHLLSDLMSFFVSLIALKLAAKGRPHVTRYQPEIYVWVSSC